MPVGFKLSLAQRQNSHSLHLLTSLYIYIYSLYMLMSVYQLNSHFRHLMK